MILFWVFLARMWSVDTFGQFSTVFAWVAIYGLVTDLGLDFWVTQQTSLNKVDAYPRVLVKFKLWSSLLFGLLFTGFAYLFDLPLLVFVTFLFGTYILNISHFFSCYLRGCEKLSTEAIISVIRNVLFIVSASIGVYFGGQLMWVGVCYTASCLMTALMTAVAVKQMGFKLSAITMTLATPLKTSFNVWITFLLVGLSVKVDILMLGFLANETQVAHYSAAARIFEGGLLLATAFVLTLFPALTRSYTSQPADYYHVVIKYCKLLLFIVVIAAVIGAVVGGSLFTTFYGQSYQPSAAIFIYLMLILPVSAVVHFLYTALVIAKQAQAVIILLLLGFLLNVLLDWLLIPGYLLNGVMASFYIKEMALLVGLAGLLYRLRKKDLLASA